MRTNNVVPVPFPVPFVLENAFSEGFCALFDPPAGVVVKRKSLYFQRGLVVGAARFELATPSPPGRGAHFQSRHNINPLRDTAQPAPYLSPYLLARALRPFHCRRCVVCCCMGIFCRGGYRAMVERG
jgi:hypothetical protein